MENRLDYCCYWMGLSMIGSVPALINNNLRQESLHHTVTVINCKAVIFSAETMPGNNKCVGFANMKLFSILICLMLLTCHNLNILLMDYVVFSCPGD